MSMPETALNLDYSPVAGKHEIRFSGQSGVMQPITESSGVESPADLYLRLGVLVTDARHHSGSRRTINNVSHILFLPGEYRFGSSISRQASLYREYLLYPDYFIPPFTDISVS